MFLEFLNFWKTICLKAKVHAMASYDGAASIIGSARFLEL